MVQSRAEWEALQRRLPPEDRESYENYLSSLGYTSAPPTPLAAREGGTIAAVSIETQNRFQPSVEQLELKAENAATAADKAASAARKAELERLKKETEAKQLEAKAKTAATAAARAKAAADAKAAREKAAELRKKELEAERKAQADAAAAARAEAAAKAAAEKAAAKLKAEQEEADRLAAKAAADAKAAQEEAERLVAAAKTAEEAKAAAAAKAAADEAAAAAAAEKEAADAKAAAEAEKNKKVVSVTYEGTGKNRIRITKYDNNTETRVADPEEEPTPAGTTSVTTSVATTSVTTSVATTSVTTSTATAAVAKQVVSRVSADVQNGIQRYIITYSDNTTEDEYIYLATGEKVSGFDWKPTTATTSTATATTTLTTSVATAVTSVATAAATVTITPVTTSATTVNTSSPYDINRVSAIRALQDRFAKYGLSSLANKILELAQDGATEATITLQLAETPEYQMRFRANDLRLKKGLTVLTPAEYLNLEDGYRQILRAYGLKQFDSDDYVSQFIANDVSPAELSNRVVTAVQRVQNADPAIAKTLRDFYGIGTNDLVAYVLDPEQQFQKIERQVAAAEIGTAARIQGIEAGVGTAEALAAQGITQAEARRGYSTIADILPTAEKLSQIYGGVEESYGLAEAEQEVFNSLAEAQRRRQRLTAREIASFGGSSGVGRTSLSQTERGQF